MQLCKKMLFQNKVVCIVMSCLSGAILKKKNDFYVR